MTIRLLPHALLAVALMAAPALAQQQESASPFGGLGNSKDPIKIDADRLEIFDKEQRAVFLGNVVAVQGDTTMRCSQLVVHYDQSATRGGSQAGGNQASAAQQAAGQTGGTPAENNIKKLDCAGPVTVVSKDQTATGDNATFDRQANRVFLTGKVALSQGQNVQQCDHIVYDLNTSIARCESKPGGRVQGVFVPGGNEPQKPARPR
ncbi:Lipopolysaccharide export system protein LptA [Chelatococcus sambhunathii]|uniref:Lipopolysaccharide export system protein LptA n=1 Tax=Chelatococcus sambhunathii TaxID=363953 RepID=A0ABM9TZY9_9HYPH|nr:LptA/OstA family protein [Chelatococcus sambhunathii]CUA84853.1 Lipopolysaccharide export system protein LptA [Chelatococcus sambhunathii]